MLGDGQREKRAFHAVERRLVGRGDNDDGFFSAALVQIAFQKFAHFPAAFADERDDIHVRLGLRRHHAKQRGFADAAAGENAEALAAAERGERVHRLDAGLENVVDAVALERMRRAQMQADGMFRDNRAKVVQRIAEAVNHAALQRAANGHAQRRTGGDDFRAGGDAVDFAQRHQEQMMVAEADDFRQRLAVVPRRLDPAHFAHRGQRAFGFDDEADELDDAAAGFRHARLAHAAGGGLQPGQRTWNGGHHALKVWRSCSSFVSRRASITPNRVCTRQPPRVTASEPAKCSGPLSGSPVSTAD